MNIFEVLFVLPILNVLLAFYKVLEIFHIPGVLGFSIVFLTVIVKLILHPLLKNQFRTAQKMKELQPKLSALSKKHKKNPKRLQEEQMKLYKQHGVNPAAGCLVGIIQIPVFFGLYQTLLFFLGKNATVVIKKINEMVYFSFLKISNIDPWFFGFNLAISPKSSGEWYYLFVPVITAVLQYYQAEATTMTQVPKAMDKKNPKKDKDKKEEGDFQKAMSMQFKFFLPLMIAYFSYTLPVGLSLYWDIFSLFTILQYKHIQVNS